MPEISTTRCATKLSFSWFGTQRSLDHQQIKQAADTFEADSKLLTARKKLIDTKHPKWRELTALKGDILEYWRAHTTPYPENGIRLLPKTKIEQFNSDMAQFRFKLRTAVLELDNDHYVEMRNSAEERLGALFNPEDYPSSIESEFNLSWEFPSVEPPLDLKDLAPAIYEQERAKAQAKLQEAVVLAQQAFATELAKMLEHLSEKLQPGEDGKKRVFRDSTIDNLKEFFQRFESLKLTDDSSLEDVVAQAKQLIAGVEAKDLRTSDLLRTEIQTGVSQLTEQLSGMIQQAPRRKIVLPPQQDQAA